MKKRQSNNRIDAWLASRPWNLLPYSLPVLLVGMLALLLVLLLFCQPRSAFQRRYETLVKQLLARGKFEEARVACLRGLSAAKNEQDSAQWLYYMAVAVNGLGDAAQAQTLVNAAAPLDQPGSPDAQFLVGENLLSATNLTTGAIETARLNPTNQVALVLHQAERHLLNALSVDPGSLRVNEALGRFYLKTHQQDKAQAYLLKIYAAKPETALLLAVSAEMETNDAAAIQWSERAISAFEQKLLNSAPVYDPADRQGLVQALLIKGKQTRIDPNQTTGPARAPGPHTAVALQDRPEVWLGIVRLLVLNNKFGPALQTLEQLLQTSTNADYAATYADICARWANSIPPAQTNGAALRFQLIKRGLAKSPDNLALQFLLFEAAQARDDSRVPAAALLTNLLAAATGPTAASWQFVFWTDGRVRGDLAAARKHLQAAYQLAPDNPIVLNDMAMDLATGNRSSQEQALKLIQSLLDRYPYDPGYRDTRGQILALLGRNREAAEDLTFAAARLSNPVETRRILAKVNAALGITSAPAQTSDPLLAVNDLINNHQFDRAIDLLNKQSAAAGPDPSIAKAQAEVYAAYTKATPRSKPAERLKLIAQGLKYDPDNQTLATLLVQASRQPGPSGEAARQMLDQVVVRAAGESVIQWHFLLGQDARERGDLAAAREHLEKAIALAPDRAEIQIELARIYSLGDAATLARGLALIQPAVDQFPDNPDFRNLRGLILARLGRNQEAVDDLAFAATRLANPVETLNALAKVYDALGKPQLAEQQRRKARADKSY